MVHYLKAGLIALLFAALGCTTAAQADPPPDSAYVPSGYTLMFRNEFDEQGLNRDRWVYRYTGEYLEGVNAEESITQPGDGFLCLATREHCAHLPDPMTVDYVHVYVPPS